MKFVIIVMGQFGRALALNLTKSGYEVTVLDQQEEVINEIKESVALALIGDATDIRVLRQLELEGDDIYVIVAIGEGFERSILITAQLKEMGVKKLYARSVNNLHGSVLKLIGVKELFRVEDVAAKELASKFIHEGLMRTRKIDQTHALAEVNLPREWIGKRLREVDMRSRHAVNMLTVRRGEVQREDTFSDDYLFHPEQPVIDNPGPDFVFEKGDVLVLFGKDDDLERFVSHFNL